MRAIFISVMLSFVLCNASSVFGADDNRILIFQMLLAAKNGDLELI